jgi:hypothetical protein
MSEPKAIPDLSRLLAAAKPIDLSSIGGVQVAPPAPELNSARKRKVPISFESVGAKRVL